jgi:hypothetical protein
MDDAIDLATRSVGIVPMLASSMLTVFRRVGNLGAAYVFAAPPAAKYITQFIGSPTSFVNHVPLDILCRLPASTVDSDPANSDPNSQPHGWPVEPSRQTIFHP